MTFSTEQQAFEAWWQRYLAERPNIGGNPDHLRNAAWAAWTERAKWEKA